MRMPEIVLPAALAAVVSRLPVAPPSWVTIAVLNQLVRRGVVPLDMSLLAGRRFEVRVIDAGLRLVFAADHGRFVPDSGRGEPDLKISAKLVDFGRMMLREEDPDTLFFHRKLMIEGDTELGLIVKNMLDSVDWSKTPLHRFMNT
jgi:predicted lipid carrier protein YhbT